MSHFCASNVKRILSLSAAASLLALTVGFSASPGYAQAAAQQTVANPVVQQEPIPPKAVAQYVAFKKFLKTVSPTERKLSSGLIFASRKAVGKPIPFELPRRTEVPEELTNPLKAASVVAKNGETLLRVDIRATVTDALLQIIKDAGGNIVHASRLPQSRSAYPITAFVPAKALETIAARPEVKRIRGGSLPMTDRYGARRLMPMVPLAVTGPINSEGDRTHAADRARTTYGVNGSGVSVGVLSDSDDSRENSQSRGELPGSLTVLPGQSGRPGSGEGTAMMEIIHDLAPGAGIFFATAFGGEASYADNIRALRDAGCKVIVDDIWYFTEPAFEDGPIAQAVNEVTDSGVAYFATSGNRGNNLYRTSQAWEGDFNDSGVDLTDEPGVFSFGRIHQFPNELFNSVSRQAQLQLQWSDAFGTSANDYDLIVISPNGDITYSADFQDGEGTDPIEGADPFNPLFAFNGDKIYVVAYRDDEANPLPEPRYMRLFSYSPSSSSPILSQQTGSVSFTHATSEKAFSVAATPAIPNGAASVPGPFPRFFGAGNTIESFSSDGPRRHFYNNVVQPDGTIETVPITPDNFLAETEGGKVIPKPDLTAADGVKTSVPGFSPFFGTSAAAPHAAAITALVRSAGPSLTIPGVRYILANSTIDIMTPGFDPLSGNGILMADRAVGNVTNFLTASAVRITNITENSATVTWTTNVPATTYLRYTEFITVTGGTIENSDLTRQHTVQLTGLRPATKYFLDIASRNDELGISGKASASFDTKTSGPEPVRISNVRLSRNSLGRINAQVTILNTSETTVRNVQITGAKLKDTAALTRLPILVSALPGNGQVNVVLQFPSLPSGTRATLVIDAVSGTKSISSTREVTVP